MLLSQVVKGEGGGKTLDQYYTIYKKIHEYSETLENPYQVLANLGENEKGTMECEFPSLS